VRFEGRHATVAVLLLLFPLLAGYALLVHAPCDDAYIFATYARSLLEGNGLTFNGERVEGFTSTLWVVLAIVPGWLGVPLPLALDVASLLSAGAALLATYSLGRAVGLTPPRALLAACLVAATGDLAFYASNGMENVLFAALTAWTLAVCAGREPRGLLVSGRLPLLLAVLTFTRPEGALVVVAVVGWLGWRARSPLLALRCAAIVAAMLFPIVLIKKLYYGYWLPNTYYVKANAGLANLDHGLDYLLQASGRYAPVVAFLAIFLALRVARRRASGLVEIVPAAIVFVLWLLYVLVQGGDGLIGARMLLPAIPLLYVMTVKMAEDVPIPAATAAVVVLCLGLVWSYLGDDLIRTQTRRWRQDARLRERIGLHLRDNFPPGTLVAVNAAGIIPYFSEQPTIDMLGLNDEQIAHHGKRDRSLRLGHQAGDGAYVLSRSPGVILFGRGGTREASQFVSDREIWRSPGFSENYRVTSIEGRAWAWVRVSTP
jgi:arabinofuranosyltransferase